MNGCSCLARLGREVYADHGCTRRHVDPLQVAQRDSGKHGSDLRPRWPSVCPLGGFAGAHGCFISNWRGVPQGSPQGQKLGELLLRGTSVLHWQKVKAQDFKARRTSAHQSHRSEDPSENAPDNSNENPSGQSHSFGDATLRDSNKSIGKRTVHTDNVFLLVL